MESKLMDPIVNVKIGTAYLSHLKEMFNDVRLALTAYHSGPTRVKLKLAAKDRIRFAYAGRVLSAKRSFEKNWKELMAVPGQHETGGRQIS